MADRRRAPKKPAKEAVAAHRDEKGMLSREEYVEQAYFFQTLRERMQQDMATQDLLDAIGQEILATTMLPLAVQFMADELRLTGGFATAMARLPHYFTPFQSYVVREAEKADGRFDFRIALEVLQREVDIAPGRLAAGHLSLPVRGALPQPARLRSGARGRGRRSDLRRRLAGVDPDGPPPGRVGGFRRHDLRPQRAVSQAAQEGREADPLRREGRPDRAGQPAQGSLVSVLRPAAPPGLSHRAASRPEDTQRYALPALERRLDRLETRLRLLEEDMRGGINLPRFYVEKPEKPGPTQR